MVPIRKGDGTGLGAKGFSQIRKGDGTVLWNAIPDSDVYLHDDWGDNKLTNRDDSGTTTYNGVEGVYRPEWTIDNSDPVAQNTRLEVGQADALRADINLNLDETITWDIGTIDLSLLGTSSGDHFGVTVYSETADLVSDPGSTTLVTYARSYFLLIRRQDTGNALDFREVDANHNATVLISEGNQGNGQVGVKVTRTPAGEWELFVDETSSGTASDTNHTDPQITAVSARGDSDMGLGVVNEYKGF